MIAHIQKNFLHNTTQNTTNFTCLEYIYHSVYICTSFAFTVETASDGDANAIQMVLKI